VIVRLFVDPGDEVITCVPSYEVYRLYGQIAGAKIVEVPRGANFELIPGLVLKAITEKTKLIFLCNPNNPTGTTIPEEDIIEIVNSGIPVVVDEAYYEFSRLTMLPYVDKYPNMMLVRTFSKWAAMAGFRLGYGIVHPDLSVQMYKIKPPFGVGVPALVALKASLEDREYLMNTVQKIIDERDRVSRELGRIGPFKPYPSKGNFIFFKVLRGDAGQITAELEKRGIMLRHFNTPLLKHGIRFSIGKPEQNDKVLAALKDVSSYL
jgi:histidinol-phosphate aminotransferase